jgi:hypothetical protein
MRADAECYPSFLNQALKTARLSSDERRVLEAVLDEVGAVLRTPSFDGPPPIISEPDYVVVRDIGARKGDVVPVPQLSRRRTRR